MPSSKKKNKCKKGVWSFTAFKPLSQNLPPALFQKPSTTPGKFWHNPKTGKI